MEVTRNTENKTTIQSLQQEARKDKWFNAVCLAFATRERARNQVSVNALTQSMNNAGYKDFTKSHAMSIITTLAKLGIGTPYKNTKGKLMALVNIKYTLQSVGKAALEGSAMSSFRSKKKRHYAAIAPAAQKKVSVTLAQAKKPFILSGQINDNALDIPLTSEQFSQFLSSILTKKH